VAVDLVKPIPYPVDLATVFLRAQQTYGRWIPPPPTILSKFVVKLPAGLMFVMASRGRG
jgi:hypothetical protein